MKTLFSMFAVIGTLLLVSCSKGEAPRNDDKQRPEFSNTDPNTLPLFVKVINNYSETAIVKVFINNNSLFEMPGDLDRPDGRIPTTALKGENAVKVIVFSRNGGRIVVTDSRGTAFCQPLEPDRVSEISFENIMVNATADVIIEFLPGECPAS